MRKTLIIALITVQFVSIFFLLIKIFKKKQEGQKISINIIPKKTIKSAPTNELHYFFEPLPNSTEVVKKEWLSEDAIYRINSDSLNERYEYKEKKDKGVYRIITVGDSFTFGVNISTQYNWTELLEDELNKKYVCNKVKKYEVINLGVGTYDTDYEIQRYMTRGKKYNPDLIIWYIIDIKRFTDKVIDMENNMKIKEGELKEEDGFFKEWALAQRKVLESLKGVDIYDLQLSKIRKVMDSIPTKNYLFLVADDNLSPYKQYLGINNSFITLHPGEHTENLLLDGHYNKLGHAYVKNKVMVELLKDGLIPCVKR